MKKVKQIAIHLATFTVLLAVANGLCGLYLKNVNGPPRHELPNYKQDPRYAEQVFADYGSVQHQYEPFVGWRMKAYSGKTLHVSSAGMRITPSPPFKGVRNRVVRFFGGSTMWGEGADDQNTIPAIFNALHPEYNVFNHAQLAFNTRQELDALISLYARNEQADLVIFYDGVNDVAFLCPEEIRELPAHRLVPMYRDKLYTGKSQLVIALLHDIFTDNILAAIRRVSTGPTKPSPYNCVADTTKAEQIAEMMIRNWELAHQIVTSRNGQFVALLQPAAYIGSPRTDHLQLDDQLGENFREVYRRIKRKISERNHPWIIDLSDRFDGSDYIFIDFCHVSPNGNQIIAREISNIVHGVQNQHVAVSYLHP